MRDLRDALHSMELKDGDVVFFDTGAIEVEDIDKVCSTPGCTIPAVTFISVCLRCGQAIEDAVFSMSRGELEALLKEKPE